MNIVNKNNVNTMTWNEFINTLTPRKAQADKPEQTRITLPTPGGVICPNCGTRCASQATVSEWLQPEGWHFYGEAGNRGIKCQGKHFVHFRAGEQNRIAWVKR